MLVRSPCYHNSAVLKLRVPDELPPGLGTGESLEFSGSGPGKRDDPGACRIRTGLGGGGGGNVVV